MDKYQSTLLVPSIDSLRLSFPLELVTILEERVLNKTVYYQATREDTGEIIEEAFTETNSELLYFEDEQTYQIKARIENWFGTKKLSILLNAKILEDDYLQGITMGNIRTIYDKLQGYLFDMTFEDFLTLSQPTDIDVKKDIEVPSDDEFDNFTKELERASKKFYEINRGVNRFSKKTNKGIEWNGREKSTYGRPFMKIYHKFYEAKFGDHHAYFDKYLDFDKIRNRVRIEVTIKNKKEADKYKVDTSNLLTLLSTSEDTWYKVIDVAITKNIEPRKPLKKARTESELKPMDRLAYLHLTNMIQNQQYDFERALEWTISQYDDKQQRHTIKKKMVEIYNETIKGQEYEVRTASMNKFFDAIGWK